MWVIVLFVMFHIYAAVREEINGRLSLVGAMISGYKTFKK